MEVTQNSNNNNLIKLYSLINYFVYQVEELVDELDFNKYCNGSGNLDSVQVIRKLEKFIINYNYRIGYQKRYIHLDDDEENDIDEDEYPYDYPVYLLSNGRTNDIITVCYISVHNLSRKEVVIIINDKDFHTLKYFKINREMNFSLITDDEEG